MKINQWMQGPIRNRFEDERFGPTSVEEADEVDDVFDDEDSIEEEVYEEDDEPEDQMIPLSAVLKMQQSFQQPQQAPVQQQAPQLTKEEMEERLKVFRANEKHVERLLNSDSREEQVAVLNEIVNGIVTHLTTVSGYSNQILLDQLSKQYAPALEMVREREMSNFTKDIQRAYPALKGYDPVIAQTIQFLKAQGYKPANGEEALRTVAGQVEALLKTANPQFSLARRPKRQQSPTNGMPRMASLSGGVRGAAGGSRGGSNGGQKKAAYNDIWD